LELDGCQYQGIDTAEHRNRRWWLGTGNLGYWRTVGWNGGWNGRRSKDGCRLCSYLGYDQKTKRWGSVKDLILCSIVSKLCIYLLKFVMIHCLFHYYVILCYNCIVL